MIASLALAMPSVEILITILVVALLVGLVFWAANKYLEIAQPFKGIVLFIIVLIFVIWVASQIV